MSNIILLIIGMAVVTYLPRLTPFMLVYNSNTPPKLKRFLLFIPYTALGALIIPGVLTAIPNEPIVALIGISIGGVLAWMKGGIILPVLGAIAVVYCLLMLAS
ncbi:AzlD domain-containing protein [Alkaliphilus hydrothermalis]|uniref:Branched-subunit amino acid transport protein n=1 Tax=Alkaliphilus hydrothermalis TaxID=1482730 RepID=A0ABS2NRZ7_9FIRM|nr:AzlD domain-containing protein [Alkaliphilus hydrothermalis]MBM7615735.1 branched-subunit amino acid transport protein [Alkaliphilus hydrothermalis]